MAKFKEDWQSVPKWLRIVIYSILGVLGMAAIGVLFGFVIMWLWNWLMPGLFGLKAITYWQGVGLFILAKILFGAIGGSSGDSKKPKDKKESRFDPHKGSERKAEPDGVEYYDEWWEKEGKMAFDDFVNNRYTSEEARETESERGRKG
jgi:hypothetical protein